MNIFGIFLFIFSICVLIYAIYAHIKKPDYLSLMVAMLFSGLMLQEYILTEGNPFMLPLGIFLVLLSIILIVISLCFFIKKKAPNMFMLAVILTICLKEAFANLLNVLK
jgi:hypothetical protein